MEDKLKTRVDTNTDVSIKKRSEYGVKVDQNYTGPRILEFVAYKARDANKISRMFGKWNKRCFYINIDSKEFFYKDGKKASKCKLIPLEKLSQVKRDKGLSKRGRVVTLFSKQRLIHIKFNTNEDLEAFVAMMGAVIHLEDNLPLYVDPDSDPYYYEVPEDKEKLDDEKERLRKEIELLRQTLGMKQRQDSDDLSSAEEKSKKMKKKKKKTKEEQELEFLKMQQENLEKQISKIKGSKKKSQRGGKKKRKDESFEDLEFDDSQSGSEEMEDSETNGYKPSRLSQEEIIVENFPSQEQVDDNLESIDKPEASYESDEEEEQNNRMRGRRGPPGRLGNRAIDAIPGSTTNVLSHKKKRSGKRSGEQGGDKDWKF